MLWCIMKLTLIRHGECLFNTPRMPIGSAAYAFNFLTEKGYRQAELCAIELRDRHADTWDFIFTSNVLMAMQTASVILQKLDAHDKYDITKTDLLNEWWDNPKGKTQLEFRHQIDEFYTTNLKPLWNTDMKVLIVSHGYTTRCLIDVINVHEGRQYELTKNIHNIPGHAPNAFPFFHDTANPKPLKYTTPGLHSVKYA